jgi:hypothetical protein
VQAPTCVTPVTPPPPAARQQQQQRAVRPLSMPEDGERRLLPRQSLDSLAARVMAAMPPHLTLDMQVCAVCWLVDMRVRAYRSGGYTLCSFSHWLTKAEVIGGCVC